MTRSTRELYAVGAIASVALVVALWGACRQPSPVPPVTGSAASACVDTEARARLARLEQAVARRDAQPELPHASPPEPVYGPVASGNTASPPGEVLRYARIDVSNRAVTVTQNDDGTYVIRNTDPTLTGKVLEATAIRSDGRQETLMVRVPPPAP